MTVSTYTSNSNQRWVKKYRPLDIFTGCTDEAVKNQLVVLPRILPESSLCHYAIAFSMVVDCPYIRQFVHFGRVLCPRNQSGWKGWSTISSLKLKVCHA